LLNAELRKHEFCEGVSVTEIVPVKDERLHFTWTALIQHGARLPQYEDCSRFFSRCAAPLSAAFRFKETRHALSRAGSLQAHRR
jgi:hypothetical protein